MIYAKTELGQSALRSRSSTLTPRQRSAFIMFDGKRSTNDVLKTTAGLGITEEDVKHLVGLGWLSATAGTVPTVAVPLQSGPKAPCLSAQAHYSKAYPITARLTAGLGLRGFRLNLAVEA